MPSIATASVKPYRVEWPFKKHTKLNEFVELPAYAFPKKMFTMYILSGP